MPPTCIRCPRVPFGCDQMLMSRFYTMPVSRRGTFKSKWVCLRCDLAHASDGGAQLQERSDFRLKSNDPANLALSWRAAVSAERI